MDQIQAGVLKSDCVLKLLEYQAKEIYQHKYKLDFISF